MPTPNIQIILQAIAAVTNNLLSNAPQIITFDFNSPTLPSGAGLGTGVYYEPYFQAASIGSAVSLPAASVFAILVQNLSLTANLTITYTPTGGAAASVTLGPSGMFILFDPSETGTGFSALTLTGVGGTVSAAVLVGV